MQTLRTTPTPPARVAGTLRLHCAHLAFAVLWCYATLAPAHAQDSATVDAWRPQRPTPSLGLSDLSGKAWHLPELRGTVLILNFWATWCEPCRAEMPALAQLARQFPPGQLRVLAINYQENTSKVSRFVADAHLDLPVLLDNDGAAARRWTQRIFPTSVVVDASGTARWVVTGEYDWSSPQARALIAPLLTHTAPR